MAARLLPAAGRGAVFSLFALWCLLQSTFTNALTIDEAPPSPLLDDDVMSLEEYNAAYKGASYCLDDQELLVGLNRDICESRGLKWSARKGFESEEEWREAVAREMSRLTSSSSTMAAAEEGGGGESREIVGLWITEVPEELVLNKETLAQMINEQSVSLDRFVRSDVAAGRYYYTVTGTPSQVSSMREKFGFSTVTPLPVELKVSPLLLRKSRPPPREQHKELEEEDEELNVYDLCASLNGKHTPRPSGSAALAVAWQGMSALDEAGGAVKADGHSTVCVEGITSRADALTIASVLAQSSDVDMIAPRYPLISIKEPKIYQYVSSEPINDVSAGVLQSGTTSGKPFWDMGIKGEGQIVGIRDGGFDLESCYFVDPEQPTSDLQHGHENYFGDTHRKIVSFGWFSADPTEINLSHGTHCAGTIAGYAEGDEVESDSNKYKGVAYEAKLALMSFGTEPGGYPDMFADAYDNAGARIHSNSYGSFGRGYTTNSRYVDEFMYTHQDFLVLYAAGDEGYDEGGDNTIWSPAEFKNGITVGASHHSLPEIADFSSRGPTDDGRIKPDIVAPGTDIISASSDSRSYPSCETASASGTSFATPGAAGIATLARQYFTDGYYPMGVKDPANAFTPTAALLKAVLVSSGDRMSGVEAERGVTGADFPNNNQGFGRILLDNVLVTPGSPEGLVTEVHGKWSPGCADCPQVAHGDTKQYLSKIADTAADDDDASLLPLTVTLTWTDPPGDENAVTPVINNLDLEVSEVGTSNYFYPNGRTDADPLNTVERVRIPNPVLGGTYAINVKGTDVPLGPQTYAVVISGPLDPGSLSNYDVLYEISSDDNTAAGDEGEEGGAGVSFTASSFISPAAAAGSATAATAVDGGGGVGSPEDDDWLGFVGGFVVGGAFIVCVAVLGVLSSSRRHRRGSYIQPKQQELKEGL